MRIILISLVILSILGCASNGLKFGLDYKILELESGVYELTVKGIGINDKADTEEGFIQKANEVCKSNIDSYDYHSWQYKYSSQGGEYYYVHNAPITQGKFSCIDKKISKESSATALNIDTPLVYIFHFDSIRHTRKVTLYIDDKAVAKLENGQFTSLSFAPGKYLLEQRDSLWCFRSMEGAKMFCRIRGYLLTCRKQDVSATQAMMLVFEGKSPDFAIR